MGESTGPYAAAHERYWRAGWRGVLPVGRAPGQKHPVPLAYTGYDGRFPSYPDVVSWAGGPEGERNIALRLPADVIGLDVDAYGAKVGAATLAGLVERYGPLPPTWITSARSDGVSGIRLYRVPPGLHWPGEAGPNIEIIQLGHRYAIVWPSRNPDAGGAMYEWRAEHLRLAEVEHIGDDGRFVPSPADLPELPEAWVQGLTLPYERAVRAEIGHAAASVWYAGLRQASPLDGPCRVISAAAQPALRVLDGIERGGRHETTLAAVRAIVAYGGEGHAGAAQVCTYLGQRFVEVLGGEAGRDAAGEWSRLLLGAVELAATANPTPRQVCECGLWRGEGVMFDPPPAPVAAAPVIGAEIGPEQHGNRSEPVGTGWAPQDVEQLLDGTYVPPEPALFVREDGRFLLYAGRVHSFHGESESGKSMLAQHVAAEVLRTGGRVLYLDFESDAFTVVPRLLAMGAAPAAIRERLAYVRPDGAPDAAARDLLAGGCDLAVVDGVMEGMAIMGYDRSTDNDQIVRWMRFPRALARAGAAVVLVDHVTKGVEGRGRYGIGGVAKMNALDGCAYTIEVAEPLGVGLKGSIRVRVGKDRPGQVRPHCGEFRASDRTQEAAYVVVDSTEPKKISVRVFGPRPDRDKQTELMQQISMYLEGWKTELGAPIGKSGKDIRRGVKGKDVDILAACTRLGEEGFIVIEVGRQGTATLHTSLKPYRVASEESHYPDVSFDPTQLDE